MGCSCHAHVEIKVAGRWLHYNHMRPGDTCWSYRLFAKMAGVRNGEPGDRDYDEPISEPKGLPDDLSEVTALDYSLWEGDAHSESWLSAAEIGALDEWYGKTFPHVLGGLSNEIGFLFGHSIDPEYREDWPEFLEDVRLVIWFDN